MTQKKKSQNVQEFIQALTAPAASISQEERALYEEMGTTPETIEHDLYRQGYDTQRIVQSMRSVGERIEQEKGQRVINVQEVLHTRVPHFEEAVTAGAAAPAQSDQAKWTSIANLLGDLPIQDALFANVQGDSMKDIGIVEGDVLIVNTKVRAKSGDVVLVHVEGKGQMVKRLELTESVARLHSENPAYDPIEIAVPTALEIKGVVWGRLGRIG